MCRQADESSTIAEWRIPRARRELSIERQDVGRFPEPCSRTSLNRFSPADQFLQDDLFPGLCRCTPEGVGTRPEYFHFDPRSSA